MDVQTDVLRELHELRGRLSSIIGGSVASIDGLLIAHDMPDVEPDSLSAMSASYLSLGQQLAGVLNRGSFQDTVTRGANGHVGVYAAGASALLTVLTGPDANVGRMHLEARISAERIGAVVDRALVRLSV